MASHHPTILTLWSLIFPTHKSLNLPFYPRLTNSSSSPDWSSVKRASSWQGLGKFREVEDTIPLGSEVLNKTISWYKLDMRRRSRGVARRGSSIPFETSIWRHQLIIVNLLRIITIFLQMRRGDDEDGRMGRWGEVIRPTETRQIPNLIRIGSMLTYFSYSVENIRNDWRVQVRWFGLREIGILSRACWVDFSWVCMALWVDLFPFAYFVHPLHNIQDYGRLDPSGPGGGRFRSKFSPDMCTSSSTDSRGKVWNRRIGCCGAVISPWVTPPNVNLDIPNLESFLAFWPCSNPCILGSI